MFGGVDLDLHVAVFQLHEALPDLHLLAEGIQELLPQLVHLCSTLLARMGLDFSYKWGKMRRGGQNGLEWKQS